MLCSGEWTEVYHEAAKFVSRLALTEKVDLICGIGYLNGRCLGETGPFHG